jgi:hypothetical protein
VISSAYFLRDRQVVGTCVTYYRAGSNTSPSYAQPHPGVLSSCQQLSAGPALQFHGVVTTAYHSPNLSVSHGPAHSVSHRSILNRQSSQVIVCSP